MRTENTESLENIIDKEDEDLMKMVKYISNPFAGLRNRSKFKVFTLETSRGKTTGTAYAIAKAIKNKSETKYVFTTKTHEECENVTEKINKEVGTNVVMHYKPNQKEPTATCSADFFECCKKQVLVITHATYLNLCSPKTEFHKNYASCVKDKFNFLVIDEEINAVVGNLCNFSDFIYESTLKLIKSTNNEDILFLFDKLCELPKKTIEFYESKKELKDKIIVAEELDEDDVFTGAEYDKLIKLVKSIDIEVINDYNSENNTDVTKNTIIEEIEKIYILYMNVPFDKVLYWKKTLYSCNFNFEFLMLKNNVMLDASANFNTLYAIGKTFFDVVKSKRIIDHSKCYLHWHDVNTSKSAKKKSSDNNQLTDWRKFITDDIQKKARKDSEVLIISSKAECDALEKRFFNDEFKGHFKNYALLNFFNMRGVDDYAKYEECFIIHTHRFAFPIYVLMYMYYKKIENAYEVDMTYGKYRGDNSIGFKDMLIDSLLQSDEISSLYQACKRICRSRDPVGNFHVYNSNLKVVKHIQKELLNVRIIPDEENKKMKKADDFCFTLDKIREGAYSDYKITDKKKGKKVKAVKSIKGRYQEVNRNLFYEILEIDSSYFTHHIKDKMSETDLKIKFDNEVVRVYP